MWTKTFSCEPLECYEVSAELHIARKSQFLLFAYGIDHNNVSSCANNSVTCQTTAVAGKNRIYGFFKANDTQTNVVVRLEEKNASEEKHNHKEKTADDTTHHLDVVLKMEKCPTDLKPGLSLLIRSKNEEKTIGRVLKMLSPLVDEIIYVDNGSTDNSLEIAQKVAKTCKKSNIVVSEYFLDVPRVGSQQKAQLKACEDKSRNGRSRSPLSHFDNEYCCGNTLGKYYNYVLRRASHFNVMKWDADCIPNVKNFAKMIEIHHLRGRFDAFSLWCTGETLFCDNNCEDLYKKIDSVYDEYRVYSKKCGFRYRDNENWEGPSHRYFNKAKKEVYKNPVFYELRPVERVLQRPIIDIRDQVDHQICLSLMQQEEMDQKLVQKFDFDEEIEQCMPSDALDERIRVLYVFPQFVCGGVSTLFSVHKHVMKHFAEVYPIALKSTGAARSKNDITVWDDLDHQNKVKKLHEMHNKKFTHVIWSGVYHEEISKSLRQAQTKFIFLTHSDVAWFSSEIMKYVCENDTIATVNDITMRKFVEVNDKWKTGNRRSSPCLRRFLSLNKNKINFVVWPNATVQSDLDLKSQRKPNHLVFVARLNAPKLPLIAIEAVSKIPNLTLEIIGDGPQMMACKKLVKDRNIADRITVLGEVTHAKTLQKISECDACLFLSSHEGIPLVILEAMRLKTFCISTTVGGIPELVVDGFTGLAVHFPKKIEDIYEHTISISDYDTVTKVVQSNHSVCVAETRNAILRWLNMPQQQKSDIINSAYEKVCVRLHLLQKNMMKTFGV